jgi:hypothetical protein
MSRYTASYKCPCGFNATADGRELINKIIKDHRGICTFKHKRVQVQSDIEELPSARVMNLFKDIVPLS